MIGLVDAFCQNSDILGVVGNSFKIAVALIGVPDVVAQPQNTLLAVVSIRMILIAQKQFGVIV